MTQPSRTTESISRDNKAIRDIIHQARELTVPDRATLTLGLVGHLATMMNRSQMTKLMQQLQEEVARVQDVPPSRQHEESAGGSGAADHGAPGDAKESVRRGEGRDGRPAARQAKRADGDSTKRHGDVLEEHVPRDAGSGAAESRERARGMRESAGNSRDGSEREGVGQAGRGEFRSGRLM